MDGHQSNASEAEVDSEIGYRKPPRHTQFKKGQSGNPAGRPKKNAGLYEFSKNWLFDGQIATTSGGVTISKLEGYVRTFIGKASKGHTPSFRRFMKHAKKAKLLEAPKENTDVVGHFRYDTTTVREEIKKMRAEKDEVLARIRRGELQELERIDHGKRTF